MVQVVEITAAVVVEIRGVIQSMDLVKKAVHRVTWEVSAAYVCNLKDIYMKYV
jgi:hypothetical protein